MGYLRFKAAMAFSTVALLLAAGASAAITQGGGLYFSQSGTPAPDGFDPSLAVMEHGVAVIADEPHTHQTWIGAPLETNSGMNHVSYKFKIIDHELRFYPVVTPFIGLGTMDMAYYLLWEPAPDDFSFETYRVSPNGPLTLAGWEGLTVVVVDEPDAVPEPSGVALVAIGLAAGAVGRRRRAG